ncbi:MAG: twin-arginine translocase TatA/TatE family subunit [Solirubrobacteraceae bacterium]|jgi:sec-independent protein translocase protein TatA
MGLDNPLHIALLVVILLLVFGAKRLPEMGRSIGTGMREFKDSISGDSTPALTQTTQTTPAPAQAAAAQAPATSPSGAAPQTPVASQPAPVEPPHQA